MAKSKHAPALFEVINKQQEVRKEGRVPLPKWWKGRDAAASEPEAPDAHSPGEAADGSHDPGGPTAPSAGPAPSPLAPPAAPESADASTIERSRPARRMVAIPGDPPDDEAPQRPIFSLHAGRLELSLNPVNGAIAAGVLLLTIYVGFELGRSAGRQTPLTGVSAGATSLDDTSAPPVNQDVLKIGQPGGGSPPPKPITPARPGTAGIQAAPPGPRPQPVPANPELASERVPGLNYVVLESFADSDRADAEHAQAWFQQAKGIGTTIERKGDRWQLVTTRGYDWTSPVDKSEAERFSSSVPKLGQEYKAAFAGKRQIRYLFKDAVIRKW